jgi:hypothetical protein
MNDVTRILSAIEEGDPHASEQLLPLVYDELRKLAAQKLVQEKQGQTLQATALVHEAYLRLIGFDPPQSWDSRGHFFAAAAEAMRRILIDSARRKRRPKHGGGRHRVNLDEALCLGEAAERQPAGSGRGARRTRARRILPRPNSSSSISSPAWDWKRPVRSWASRTGPPSGTGPMRVPGCTRLSAMPRRPPAFDFSVAPYG